MKVQRCVRDDTLDEVAVVELLVDEVADRPGERANQLKQSMK